MNRNLSRRRTAFSLALVMLALACMVPFAIGVFAAEGEADYVAPGYVVDFASPDAVGQCYDAYHLTAVPQDGAMRLLFDDNGGGKCDDPYLSLALPAGVDCTAFHYMAMLVRTDKHDLRGELRFRTATTGNDYPWQPFRYQATDDWQLVVVDLTDRATMIYASAGMLATGVLTNIRLDMFNNDCPSDTLYEIRAYGLYDNAADAATFVHFPDAVGTETETEPEPTPDYSAIWRGEAYASPALRLRMRWLTYGFTSTAPIDGFLSAGYGGVVSNVNFTPTYLRDDREFELLAKVYDYANGLGMTTWIYDEYQWPSGKAFGQVLEGHGEYEATGVEHHRLTGNGGTAGYVCAGQDIRILCADLTDAAGTRSLEAGGTAVTADASGAWRLDVYVLRKTYSGTENPGDFTTLRHVDLLNPEAVARFITLTHERYRDRMGDAFRNVDAFFTDEPQLGNRGMRKYVVWTPGLEDKFRTEYGYKLNLPSLFSGDTDADRLCRMQYYRLVAKLFRESYTAQISAWCRANGVESSGHLLFEENMNDHIETYGGDFLRVIGGMTIPGVDLLWVDPAHLMSENYIGSTVGIRYVASAAKNMGERRVMVEFNPNAANALSAEHPLLDCVGGVSLTRLLGTTDYNVINPQNDLTRADSEKLNLYVGRLYTLLEDMDEAGQVAVFYPIATVQALHDADSAHGSESGNKRSASDRLDSGFQALCRTLLQNDYLYSVLDDDSLCGATVANDGCLCVGAGAYRTVVVPFAQYISVDALSRLVAFRQAGGTVIFVGDKPVHGLAAGQDADIAGLMAQLADSPSLSKNDSRLTAVLADSVRRPVTIDRADSVISGDFAGAGCGITYLANTATDAAQVTLRYVDGYAGEVTVYYPLSGRAEVTAAGDGLALSIPAYEAVLILRQGVDDHRASHKAQEPDAGTGVATDTTTGAVPETDTARPSAATDETAASETHTLAPTGGTGCSSAIGACVPALLLSVGVCAGVAGRCRRRENSTFL